MGGLIKINKSKLVAVSAILSTAAILLGYIEFMLPIVPPIAGIKLGLGNIVVLLAIKLFANKTVPFCIMLSKVIVCAMLFAGFGGLPYSLAGGILSFFAMLLLQKYDGISAAGISAVGGAIHMAAQLVVAVFMTSTVSILNLLPVLISVGTVTGFINGIIVNLIEGNINKYLCAQNL